jgi:hypothetical protein
MKTQLCKVVILLLFYLIANTVLAQGPPADPTNFIATGNKTDYNILLTWNDNSDNETGFDVTKEWVDPNDNSHYENIFVSANATSFLDVNLEPNVEYHYSLSAEGEFGESNTVYATGIVFRQPPPIPANVSAATGPFFSIQLTFTDNSNEESYYEIQHTANPNDFYGRENVSGGAFNSIITYFIGDGPFNEFNPPAPDEVAYDGNTTVYIKVRAIINDHGKTTYGSFSPVVTAVTNPAPVAPTNFTTTLAGDHVHLTWVDNSISEAAYFVTKYKTGEYTNGVPIFQLPVNATAYDDYGGLEPNVEYTYVVRPVDIFQFSTSRPEWWPTLMSGPLTATATVMKVVIPEAVSDLNAVAIDSSTIDLSFTLIGMSETEFWYDLEIGTSPDGPFSIWPNTADPSMEIDYLEPATTYYFRVHLVYILDGQVHYGSYSNIASATTSPLSASAPVAPLAKLGTFVMPTSFTANWKSVAGADHYELDVFNIKDSIYLSGYEGKVVYDTSFHVTGTRASRRYIYVVRAVNENGESPNSNTIFVTLIKGLTLRTVCSNDPSTSRRWKIINNNYVPVEVSWHVNNTSQTGTHLAVIGESYFMTQTVSGLNKTTITWMDDKLVQHSSTKSSTWKTCVNDSLARSYVSADEFETKDLSLTIVAYPNSVTDKFQVVISAASNKVVQVEVVNLQGICMITKNVMPNTNVEFDASGYTPGIYLVRARQMAKHITLKLSKQ